MAVTWGLGAFSSDPEAALTVCGNGTVERGEQCDDGNDRALDGCSTCLAEPVCSGGVCMSVWRDGQRSDDEACDDGDRRNGDGCNVNCRSEVTVLR